MRCASRRPGPRSASGCTRAWCSWAVTRRCGASTWRWHKRSSAAEVSAVTEAQWMQSTDLSAMLEALGGEVSDSRLRLFACACCRRIWDVIDTDLHRRAVEYAEWFARGPGRDIQWLGSGHWTNRRLSCPIEQIESVKG